MIFFSEDVQEISNIIRDNRWTIRTTEWQVRKGRRPRGRPKMRWKDDIMKWQGATWTRTAKDRKKWLRTYGGLLPAVEEHSLGIRYKVQEMKNKFNTV